MPVSGWANVPIVLYLMYGSHSFHPDFHDRNSQIQREMMEYMQKWVQGLGHKQQEILGRLSKDSVRNHRNIRLAGEGGSPAAEGTFAVNAAHQAQHDIHGYASQIPVIGSAIQFTQGLQGASGHNQPPGYSHHSHGQPGPPQTPGGGLLGNIPGLGKIGEAQAFLGQFGGGPGRRDIPQPGYPSHSSPQPPSMPPTSPHSYNPPGGGPSGFPGGPPDFPGGPPAPSPYGGSSYPGAPGGPGGYAPSYAPPEPQGGYPAYGSSYGPPPGGPPPSFPGGPGYPGGPGGMSDANPTSGFGMPNANPPGPSFPGSNPYGGFGYNDPPSNRPW